MGRGLKSRKNLLLMGTKGSQFLGQERGIPVLLRGTITLRALGSLDCFMLFLYVGKLRLKEVT